MACIEKHVTRCLREMEAIGFSEDTLDDIIVDLETDAVQDQLNSTNDENAQDDIISAAEKSASDINNGGLESQVRHILKECGLKEGLHLLEGEITDHRMRSAPSM